jgi:uncharacterized protein YecT (DUF1311 family)
VRLHWSLLFVLLCYSVAIPQCSDKIGTAETAGCYAKEWRTKDSELRKIYTKILDYESKTLSKQQTDSFKKSVRESQKAWIVYRETECELQAAQFMGGTGGIVMREDCKLELTTKRIKELKDCLASLEN